MVNLGIRPRVKADGPPHVRKTRATGWTPPSSNSGGISPHHGPPSYLPFQARSLPNIVRTMPPPTIDRESVSLPSTREPRAGGGGHPCQGFYHPPAGHAPKVAVNATHFHIDFSEHYLAELALIDLGIGAAFAGRAKPRVWTPLIGWATQRAGSPRPVRCATGWVCGVCRPRRPAPTSTSTPTINSALPAPATSRPTSPIGSVRDGESAGAFPSR